jgi:hypothetical protein
MTAIITNKFRVQRASQFKTEFDSLSIEDNYYLFIAEPQPWQAPFSDDIPPPAVDSVAEHRKIWKSMLGMKRIGEIDVAHVIKRYNWQPNTVFASYSDSDSELFNHPTEQEIIDANLGGYNAGPIYCVDSNFNVYKCLNNNNESISSVIPSGTSPLPFSTGDGYTWQYMFTVNGPDILKFVTQDWIPVKKLDADDGSPQWLVQQNATPNSISVIKVTNAGSGYVDIADGDVASATFNTVVLANGGNAFDNSYNQSTIHIISGTGAGQQRVISAYDATTFEVTVAEPFFVVPDATSTYEIRPSVSISGNGSGALAKANINLSGQLQSVQITNPGTNYTIASATVSGGNIRLGGGVAQVSVELGPESGHGADAVKELGASFIMMNVQLEFNEGAGDFPTSNEYRRIGIIRDPKNFASSVSATAVTLRATKQLQLSGVSGTFLDDEILSAISSTALLVESEDLGGGNYRITYIQDNSTGFENFVVGETVTGSISGASGVIEGIINPEVEPNSGCILYQENHRPVSRQINQIEDIKITIAF